jgi:preprotein translocase subunit SecA
MDSLKEGIGLRGYGQRNPLTEYKKEAFDQFMSMVERVKEDTVEYLFRARPVAEEDLPVRRRERIATEEHRETTGMAFAAGAAHQAAGEGGPQPPREARGGEGVKVKQVRRTQPKVGRNDPCPCGSGKKYKKCCLARESA